MNKMEKNKIVMVIILLFAAVILSSGASATLGVSPASLGFPNMLRAGFSQRSILISTLSDSMIVDLVAGGNISSWINFSQNNISVSTGNPKMVYVMIRPPRDMPNGNYSGYITVKRRSEGALEQIEGIGNVVTMSIKIPVDVQITDREILACTAYSFSIESVEEGADSSIRMFLRNEGNVRISPELKVDVWNQERTEIVKFFSFIPESMLPSIDEEISFPLPADGIAIGQYWADLSVDECGASDVVTFDVLEKGALSSVGRLLQITSTPWINALETAKIDAVFINEGKKTVSARFQGTVSYAGQILSVLESESVSVSPQETVSLTTFFKPESQGRYVVEGKVYYDKKFTFSASTIINVREKKAQLFSVITVIYIIIAGASLFFLFAIFKKRRKRRRF
jgi:hypothetical protein